jgi:hypothetical protein
VVADLASAAAVAAIVPTRLRRRVFGAARAGAWASIPLGILLGGVVA